MAKSVRVSILSSKIAKPGAVALMLIAASIGGEACLADLAIPPSKSTSAKTPAATPSATNDAASANRLQECRKFVQSFYDWYAPIADKESGGAMENIMKKKGNLFSSELRTRLLEDSAAQAKSKGEIVGLDFDPFLNTNSDVAKKYLATRVVQKGNDYWVDVHGVFAGKKSAAPTVTPAVGFLNGKCVFVNFHYGKDVLPVNENLISVLKSIADDRKAYAKEASHK